MNIARQQQQYMAELQAKAQVGTKTSKQTTLVDASRFCPPALFVLDTTINQGIISTTFIRVQKSSPKPRLRIT